MSTTLAGTALFESSKTPYVIARSLEYTGTAVFYGGLAFVSLLWPAGAGRRAARLVLIGGWLLGTVATVCALGLEGAWATGRGASSLFDAGALRKILGTDFGREWAAMALLWVLGLVVLAELLRRGHEAVQGLPWRVGAGAVGLGTLRIYGMTGHAKETTHPLLAQLADVAHLAAMTLWIGGLVQLLVGVLPGRCAEELAVVMPRYSRLALASVTVAIASGMTLAWSVIGSAHALTSTTYGHILLVKIAVLVLVLAAAFGSKIWVEHRLDFVVILRGEGSTAAGPSLVRPAILSVAAETGLLLLVLTIASFLVTANPGR